ncbi:hypothetical protein ADIARSV_2387 [Arcticibacter svalbardensis MN12-7]|uniref:DUF3857 domain-containing protein n=1 Tax=Arcticibacter svalbardensis MN12-7 TaxID=1150600 RepID=R9GRS1_9SPHI|nr:DUF3857 domain-containing protein [Arcticibacter svalbardensis]EOR94398.1 hypothetical protein ADIARSV_2387 [Arcticibacter svalbardensis MN12-7]
MRLIGGILFFLLVSFDTIAQQNYAVSAIPPELMVRASAVIRNDEMSIEVKDLNDVVIRVKEAVTVLNKNGDSEARMVVWYDKTRQIKYIKAVVYDEFGLLKGKIAEKEFKDESAVSNSSLFDDTRVKRFSPAITTYPYTLEYEYEIRSKQSLSLPDWQPNTTTGVSLENAKLTLMCKPDFAIRFKEENYAGKVNVTDTEGLKTYTWEVHHLKALRDEPYSPSADTYLPAVRIAPVKFAYQSVNGSFTNWSEYGLWMNEKILLNRDIIPAETATYIKELVKDIEDPRLKAKKIYEFVQGKTRYVSVQVGIGGFQPITAAEVDRLGYGDCKGLVNYTKGLLKVVGINSYYTIVEAGPEKKSAIVDFASINQFNHIILCIPFAKDTTWVDCTSKTIPFGYLGDFTDDRIALACTETGGKLIRTPAYTSEASRQIRKASFKLDEKGNLNGEMTTTFDGLQYDNREQLIDEPFTEQVKKLQQIYTLNNLEIQSFKLEQDKGRVPVTTERMKFYAGDYASLNGQQYFITLNALNRGRSIKEVHNRVNILDISRGYTDIDEITYTIPDNYKIDGRPENFKIEQPFGQYAIDIQEKGNTLVYTRKLHLKEGIYPPEKYEDLVSFYQQVAELDESRISMIKRIVN